MLFLLSHILFFSKIPITILKKIITHLIKINFYIYYSWYNQLTETDENYSITKNRLRFRRSASPR
jgi:hypothetical protein